MGSSADVRIAFGIIEPNEETHPWIDEETGDGEPETWWRMVTGFVPTFDPYDEEGEHRDGVTPDDPRINRYFEEMRVWDEQHPIPFEVQYSGSYDYGDLCVCAPKTEMYWEPTALSTLVDFAEIDSAVEARFRAFLADYYPDAKAPKWYVIPFYG